MGYLRTRQEHGPTPSQFNKKGVRKAARAGKASPDDPTAQQKVAGESAQVVIRRVNRLTALFHDCLPLLDPQPGHFNQAMAALPIALWSPNSWLP